MLLNAHIQEHLQTGRLFATMDMRKYFKPVDKPAAVKPQKAAHATASSPSSNQASARASENRGVVAAAGKRKSHEVEADDVKSHYFQSSTSSKKQSPITKTSVDPSDFFSSSSKIHQSEKTATTRMAKKSAAVTVNKEPSFAKPSDDDEFAEFDMDLSVDESALHKLMDSVVTKGPNPVKAEPASYASSVISEPIAAKKEPSPIKETVSSPIKKASTKKATAFVDDDEDDKEVKKPSAKSTTTAAVKASPGMKPSAAKKKAATQFVDDDDDDDFVKPTLKSEPAPANDAASKKANYMKILAKRAAGGGPSAPGSKEIPVGAPNCLVGLTFVFTGELSSITRDDAQDLVKRYGGRVTGSVSGKTSYVVVGEDAGASKLTKAASLKVKTLDEDALFDLIASSSSKDAGAAAPASSASVKKSAASAGKKTAVSETVAAATKADSGSFYGGSGAAGKGKQSAASIAPKQPSTELWTTKYKPRRYEDVMGNKANVQRLATWLRGWDASKASDKPSSAKDDPGHSRAILISGPPGIGKTTAAHLVATLEGFEIVEFNASDTRSKKTVADVVKEMTCSHTMTEYFSRESDKRGHFAKRQVLIMDEVDGMSAGDRGGIAELINIIKTTKIPIICICNDRQSPKVKSLVNHCFDMRFQRPRATEIEKAVKAIAAKEGLNIGLNVMGALVDSTHADIRQILNMLSTYALQENQLNYDQSKALGKSSEKNMSKSPWDVTGQLLGRGSFRDTSFADKLELYFNDFSLIPLMIQENYIKMDPALAGENSRPPKEKEMETLDCLSKAADSIAFGDIISSVQMKTQNWGLLPFHGVTSTLRPAFFTHGSLVSQGHWGGGYAFPSWLGKNSNQGKNMRLLKEIQLHMRLHVSADKNEVRQTYLPALAPLLTLPMAQDPSGVEQVIQTMDEYYLTREDWDSILEIGLEECGLKALTADIPTATKSSFTRTYNKTNHPKPYMTASLLSKSRGGVGGGMSGVPDLEEAVENDEPTAGDEEESEEQDEDDVGGDRLIKKKVKSAAAMKKAGSANGSSKGAGRGKRAGDSVAKGVAKKQKK